MGSTRVRSIDVARRAGVSRATVSYVLNDRPGQSIPEATRLRVREAAEELGYVPNHNAKALRGQAPPILLFVTGGLPFGRGLEEVGDGLMAAAATAGYSLVTWRSGNAETLESVLSRLMPRLIISVVPLDGDDVAAAERLSIPVLGGSELFAQEFAGAAATRLQVEHLAGRGCRRLAYLGAEEEVFELFEQPRREGVLEACAALGLPAPRLARLPRPGLEDLPRLVELLREWTSGPEPVEAVACYNDFWAIGVLNAAQRAGLTVPDQLAVIGIDDEHFSQFAVPALTTISLDPAWGGAEAFRMAEDQLRGRTRSEPPAEMSGGIRLVLRDSA